MEALLEPKHLKEDKSSTSAPTGYIAIGLRETDRGLRMVRLFTTNTLPRKFQEDFSAEQAFAATA